MSTWIKLADTLPDHPKIVAAGGPAAWLYVCGLAYASGQLTDGFIPARVIGRLGDVDQPEQQAAQLVTVGLWHVVEGGWRIHDYEDHQRSKAEVEEHRDKARRRMKKRATNTAPVDNAVTCDDVSDTDDVRETFARSSREQNANTTRATRAPFAKPSRELRVPETETETESETTPQPPAVNNSQQPATDGGGGGEEDPALEAARHLAAATPGITNPAAWTHTVAQRLRTTYPGADTTTILTAEQAGQHDTPRRRPTTTQLANAGHQWGTAIRNAHHQHDGPDTDAFTTELDHVTRDMAPDEAITWRTAATNAYHQPA